ncbi:7061_t:CDS:1 [Ambispora leptoticha]|uniref:7061_t:CDS:1 n=1 Tax=Ambispora leptoticha TaxID=144679 RepID=A0A9N9CJP5_9GLOM|nr:7061_t:CDS:1 [Ambispora leptoticha]
MPKCTKELTRREKKGLIDLKKFSETRSDYPMILFIARILYRIQLRCFFQNLITALDITKILNIELNRLHRRQISIPNLIEQLENTQAPLDTIRNLLTDSSGPRKHKGEKTDIRRIYKNLITLTDDLKKAMAHNSQTNAKESTKHDFKHINFAPTDSLISENDDDETTTIEPPLPIVWLPTLTNKEKVTQRKVSAFSLRKRTGFNTSTKYRHRLLRMPHVQAISKTSCVTSNIKNHFLNIGQKNSAAVTKICMPSESIIIDIENYQYTSSSRSRPTREDNEKQGKNLMSLQNLDNPISSEPFNKSNNNSDLVKRLPSLNYFLNSISEFASENCSCKKRLTFDFRHLCRCITSLKTNAH